MVSELHYMIIVAKMNYYKNINKRLNKICINAISKYQL